MKRFCWLVGLLVLLIGCGGEPEAVVTPSPVQVLIASDDFYVGSPRVPFLIFDGAETADLSRVDVSLVDISSEPATVIWQGSAAEFADYELPYWTVYPEIPSAGAWGLLVESETAEGVRDSYQRTIVVTDEPASPTIGSLPPKTTSRTLADTEISLITSANQPVEALYEMSIAEAVESGRPSVITFATPAFCQTQVCTPVLDSTVAVYERLGSGETDFLHIEIYNDFQALTVDPAIEEWALTSEPWTFVLDADGTIAARLGGPVSPSEILTILEGLGG